MISQVMIKAASHCRVKINLVPVYYNPVMHFQVKYSKLNSLFVTFVCCRYAETSFHQKEHLTSEDTEDVPGLQLRVHLRVIIAILMAFPALLVFHCGPAICNPIVKFVVIKMQ